MSHRQPDAVAAPAAMARRLRPASTPCQPPPTGCSGSPAASTARRLRPASTARQPALSTAPHRATLTDPPGRSRCNSDDPEIGGCLLLRGICHYGSHQARCGLLTHAGTTVPAPLRPGAATPATPLPPRQATTLRPTPRRHGYVTCTPRRRRWLRWD